VPGDFFVFVKTRVCTNLSWVSTMSSSATKSISPSCVTTTTIGLSRIRNIMRSGPDEVNISTEALHVFTRATVGVLYIHALVITRQELFVEELARLAHGEEVGEVTYDRLAQRVQADEQLEFLHGYSPLIMMDDFIAEIIPLKVQYGDIVTIKKQSPTKAKS